MSAIARNGAPEYTKLDYEAVEKVLLEGSVSHGSSVLELENKFAEMTNHAHGIAFNSWTSAAYSFLRLLRERDSREEIVIPSFTFAATGNVVVESGFRPRFADIESHNFALSARTVEPQLSDQTAAIMVVHFAGLYDEMNTIELRQLADQRGIPLLEDCAESFGARGLPGGLSGSIGASFFSLYATKGISCGEGGICCTSDDEFADRLRLFRAHGVARQSNLVWRRNTLVHGQNFRLANLNAALGCSQFDQFLTFKERRKVVATTYSQILDQTDQIALPEPCFGDPSWQMFPVLVPASRRDGIVIELNEMGVGASVHFDPPLHLQTAFRRFLFDEHSLPLTEKIASQVVTLPMHSLLTANDAEAIASHLRRILERT